MFSFNDILGSLSFSSGFGFEEKSEFHEIVWLCGGRNAYSREVESGSNCSCESQFRHHNPTLRCFQAFTAIIGILFPQLFHSEE